MLSKYKILPIVLLACYFIRYLIMSKFEYLHDGGLIFVEILLFLVGAILTIIYYSVSILKRVLISILLSFTATFLAFRIIFVGSLYDINHNVLTVLNFLLFYGFICLGWKWLDTSALPSAKK